MHFMQLTKSALLTMLCTFFFSLWGGFLIISPALAGDKTVCPSGCDYSSIWDAVLQAHNEGGGTVTVGTPGRSTAETYNETIPLLEGVNVVSEGDDTEESYTDGTYSTTALKRAKLTIINGGGGAASVVRCPEGTPDIGLDGFTIENINGADTFLITIGSGSPAIKNNIIRNNQGSGHSGGIGLQGFGTGVPSPSIENNLIHNVHGPGIGNGPNSHATIKSNTIWDCNGDEGPGIGLLGKTYPTIEDNTIFENAQAGIGTCYRHPNGPIGIEAIGGTLTIPTIKGNTIYNNKAGIVLARADGDSGTINVTIGDSSAGNEIHGTSGIAYWASIRLEGLTDAVIENNYIHHHFLAGISLGDLDTTTIRDNEISYNQAGIEFDSDCLNATVENNEIHHNNKAGINNGVETVGQPVGGVNSLFVQNNNQIYLNGEAGIAIKYATSTNTIGHNIIRENGKAGIQVFKADSVTVQYNQIYENGRAGIRNMWEDTLTVTGNDIYENRRGGIEIRNGTGTIAQNTINQNQHGGIGIKKSCDLEINENQINDNLRGGIHTGEDMADGGGYMDAPGSAILTITKNKVYGNGQSSYGGGIDVRHASGIINNNLVYENHKGGIRFGDDIDEIVNNTVVGNGESGSGAGIAYDDLAGDVNASPTGCAPTGIEIKNNIATDNEMAGIFVKICPDNHCPLPSERDFNLLSRNFGWDDNPACTGSFPQSNQCKFQQLAGCSANPNEIITDPLFMDMPNDDYQLQSGSPAENAGDDGFDMGAYGGSDPITP